MNTKTDADEQGLGPKLDALIRLTALSVLEGRTGVDAIDRLALAGLDNDLIANLVGTTPATVRSRRWKTTHKRETKKVTKQ